MAKRKRADEVRELYRLSNNWTRRQWEFTNQKSYDFAHDEQLSETEKTALEEQGMPTFTINRILPVVEMLNFYATAKNPRWQAIGVEGSDSDIASVFGDLADYVWQQSDGSTLYSNAINDSICKSVGYMQVQVDPDADNGMGEVIVSQPEPFDIHVDPKCRDMLFRDASYVLIRKVLPKSHLVKLYPDLKRKINAASTEEGESSLSIRAQGDLDQHLFAYNDDVSDNEGINPDGSRDNLIEFFEVYEKLKVPNVNIFYRVPPSEKELKQIQQQVKVKLMEMEKEMAVELLESKTQMEQAVQAGEMLQERMKLEMDKAKAQMKQQLEVAKQQYMSQLQAEASKVENKVISEKEFDLLMKDKKFKSTLVGNVRFHSSRIKLTCVAGDKLLYEKILPEKIKDYPLIPFHFKWTGTPYPISAVSPLVGKQREMNKAHQIMVHNASLGSSLRWMHEEGSIDVEHWEKYSSSPGALLPVRPGSQAPTPVIPAPLSNAFFQIVQEGKQDMEYLAGIYAAMQGDTSAQHETYRGMLAMDEYGTRRVRQWMQHSIEPGLRQLGRVIMQFTQSVYTANKRFRIVQPSALQEQREVEINVPIYNDLGEAIGKSMDFENAKFDVNIVAGSTLPVNRWAYLEELKSLMQLGVVDDIAVLAETDIKNKDQIAKRKSLYSEMRGKIESQEQQLQDKEGTIETLSRQLVQAGIQEKIMQADKEIDKKKMDTQIREEKEYLRTEAQQKHLQDKRKGDAELAKRKMNMTADQANKNKNNSEKE
mgnify:CR=1 FL=1|tara:strand:- start:7628 stop:9922 length:2295 start_codon:yes stop_codon:yes gene_type:complete